MAAFGSAVRTCRMCQEWGEISGEGVSFEPGRQRTNKASLWIVIGAPGERQQGKIKEEVKV